MATAPGRSALDALAGAPADHRITLAQVGRMRLASLGARDIVHDDRHGRLWFRIGAGRPYRKIIIQLRADDLYAVEIGRLKRIDGLPEFVSDRTEGMDYGLFADQLGEAIDRLTADLD